VFGVSDGVIRFGVPEATEWQRIGNKIKAAFIFAGTYIVDMHGNAGGSSEPFDVLIFGSPSASAAAVVIVE
jgi:hypothetical protein